MFSKVLWSFRRFGLTPHKLLCRVFPGDGRRVLCVSIPKSGTHLLEKCICMMPAYYRPLIRTLHPGNIESYGGLSSRLSRLRNGQVLFSHLYCNKETSDVAKATNTVVIFMIRDPRDVLVSDIFYVMRKKSHHLYTLLAGCHCMKERLLLTINGDKAAGLPPFSDRLRVFAGWIDEADLTLRFEDLIGRKGGGSDQAQKRCIASLQSRLGCESGQLSDDLHDRIFSNASPTFRKGTTGQWREHFDEEITELFLEKCSDVMKGLGYELD